MRTNDEDETSQEKIPRDRRFWLLGLLVGWFAGSWSSNPGSGLRMRPRMGPRMGPGMDQEWTRIMIFDAGKVLVAISH
jgi:hypothetical protein